MNLISFIELRSSRPQTLKITLLEGVWLLDSPAMRLTIVWRCSFKPESFTYFLLRNRKAVCVSCWNCWCTKPWIQREEFKPVIDMILNRLFPETAHWKLGEYWKLRTLQQKSEAFWNYSSVLQRTLLISCALIVSTLHEKASSNIWEHWAYFKLLLVCNEIHFSAWLSLFKVTSSLRMFFLPNERLACFVPCYGCLTRHRFEQVLHTVSAEGLWAQRLT